MLNNSTKNVAQEVVSCLIPKKGEGVLVLLDAGLQATTATAREQKPISRVLEQTEQRRASLHQRSNSQNNTTGGTGQIGSKLPELQGRGKSPSKLGGGY